MPDDLVSMGDYGADIIRLARAAGDMSDFDNSCQASDAKANMATAKQHLKQVSTCFDQHDTGNEGL